MLVFHPEIGSCVVLMQVSSVTTAARIDGPPSLCVGSSSVSDGTFDLWELRLWVALSRTDRVVPSRHPNIVRTTRMVPVRSKQNHLVATLFSILLRHCQLEMQHYFHTHFLSSVLRLKCCLLLFVSLPLQPTVAVFSQPGSGL